MQKLLIIKIWEYSFELKKFKTNKGKSIRRIEHLVIIIDHGLRKHHFIIIDH